MLMLLGSLNLTYKCSMMSPGNSFIWGSKGQWHESQKQCWHGSLHSCECWFLQVTFVNTFTCNSYFYLLICAMLTYNKSAIFMWYIECIAALILCCCEQSKEKLIASLKESPSSGGKAVNDSAALVSELDSVRQERDILQDELRSSQHTVESVRSELAVSDAAMCRIGCPLPFLYVILSFFLLPSNRHVGTRTSI